MFTHDPRSDKVSKDFESPNLQVWRYKLERELGLQELVGLFGNGCLLEMCLDSIDWVGR
ncbi:hypothetical protein Tco_1297370, partial [Tanacetum coccineum]